MYTNYFGFSEKPFKLKPDPRFFYRTPAYQRVHDSVLNAIKERKPLILLTGAPGCGKTSLYSECTKQLDDNVRLLTFTNTTLPLSGMLDYLGDQLQIDIQDNPVAEKVHKLQETLVAEAETGRTLLIMIDDAHNLDDGVLADVLSLNQLPSTDRTLFVSLFIGLPSLIDKIPPEAAKKVVRLHLDPLPEADVAEYINYQIKVAGCERQQLFTPNSIEAITNYTEGNPRTINSLCDAALFIASLEEQHLMTPEIIEKAAQQCFLKDPERVFYEYEEETKPQTKQKTIPAEDDEEDVFKKTIEPISIEGISENSAREVLGLRFGDVSAELAAASLSSSSADVSEQTRPQRIISAEQKPPSAPPSPSNDATAVAAPKKQPPIAKIVETTGNSRQVALSDETQTVATQPPPSKEETAAAVRPSGVTKPAPVPKVVTAPQITTVSNRPERRPRHKKRRRWPAIVAQLVILLAAVGAVAWFKPEFLNLERAEVDYYVARAKQKVKTYINQGRAYVDDLMGNAQPTATATIQSRTTVTPPANNQQRQSTALAPASTPMPETAANTTKPTQVEAAQASPEVQTTPEPKPQPSVTAQADTAPTAEAHDANSVAAEQSTAAATDTQLSANSPTIADEPEPAVVRESDEPLIVANASDEANGQENATNGRTDNAPKPSTRIIATVRSIQVKPIQAEPVQAEPAQAEPVQAEPVQAEPVQAEPVQAEPAQAEQDEPVQVGSIQDDLVQAEPVQAEPVQVEPVQVEPVQVEPIQAQPDPRIEQLLASAKRHIAALRLTTPAGNNAYETLQEVFILDPDNAGALANIEQIKDLYKRWANSALRSNNATRARSYYERALTVDPNDSEVVAAMEQLSAPN